MRRFSKSPVRWLFGRFGLHFSPGFLSGGISVLQLAQTGRRAVKLPERSPAPLMKIRLLLLLGVFAGLLSMGQVLADDISPRLRPPAELDELYGPIALYPDALIALILPASTVPSDVVMAARYLDNNGDMAKIDDQDWDDSVVDLMHYPDLIKWMDENLAWTKQAGEAFLAQQSDVMSSIQRLRAKARAAGTLIDTPQQQVVTDGDDISIIPTQPDVIYVPNYDPEVVYVSRPGVVYTDPFLTFGIGYATGFWLGYDFDWGHRRIWTIDRHDRERYWRERRDWRRPYYPGRPGYGDNHFHQQPWHPPVRAPRPPASRPPGESHHRPEIQRPLPYPNGRHDHRPDRHDGHGSRPEGRSDRRDRDSNDHGHGQADSRPETGPRPATVIVPQTPSPRPPPTPQAGSSTNARPTQPTPAQNQKGRDDRESRAHERSEGTRTNNPQGRVMPLQPVRPNQPGPQPRPQSSSQSTARFHSRPPGPTPQPRAPAPSVRAHQEAAFSRQHHPEPPPQSPQHARESSRDGRDRRDSRQ